MSRRPLTALVAFLVPGEVLSILDPYCPEGTGDRWASGWEKGHCGSLHSQANQFRELKMYSDMWREPPKVALDFHAAVFILFNNFELQDLFLYGPKFLRKPQEFHVLVSLPSPGTEAGTSSRFHL